MKKRKGQPNVNKPNWQMMVDEKSGRKYSEFFQKKNEMIEPTCVKLKEFEENDMTVTHLRMDNAGENQELEKRSKGVDWKLKI